MDNKRTFINAVIILLLTVPFTKLIARGRSGGARSGGRPVQSGFARGGGRSQGFRQPARSSSFGRRSGFTRAPFQGFRQSSRSSSFRNSSTRQSSFSRSRSQRSSQPRRSSGFRNSSTRQSSFTRGRSQRSSQPRRSSGFRNSSNRQSGFSRDRSQRSRLSRENYKYRHNKSLRYYRYPRRYYLYYYPYYFYPFGYYYPYAYYPYPYYPYPYYLYAYYPYPYYCPYVSYDCNKQTEYPPKTQKQTYTNDTDITDSEDTKQITTPKNFEQALQAFADADYYKAESAAKLGIIYEPDNPDLLFVYSQSLFAQQKYYDAEKALRNALQKVDMTNPNVMYAPALYSDKDILSGQIDLLIQNTKETAINPDLQLLLGYQLIGVEKFDQAKIALENAQTNPENARAATILLDVLEKQRLTQKKTDQPEPQ